MKNASKVNDFIKALFIFLSLFGVTAAAAVIDYLLDGGFESRSNYLYALTTSLVSLALIYASYFTYIVHSSKELIYKTKEFAAICCAAAFSFCASLAISHFNVFFMPAALAAFVLVPLAGRRDVFISNLTVVLAVSSVLFARAAFGSGNWLDIFLSTVIGVFSGSLVAYVMSGVVKRIDYALRGITVASVVFALLCFATFASENTVFSSVWMFLLASVFGQVFLGLLLQPVLESLFNLVTNSRLSELTDHNSPLINRLIKEAPGTFNHSLAVASFAEMCAISIGENPYLAKACAYYHDIGKLNNTNYFAENQSGENPHKDLLPEVSAQIVRRHTTDGYDLCVKYRIPEEIRAVTVQHHGTLPIMYFYQKAKNLTDGEVDINEFSYHGQKPVTKIAALIMICDAAEATIRAMGRPTSEKVSSIISDIISDRLNRGQFDNCLITMRDLNTIKGTIISVYGGVYHARIKYPGEAKKL